MAATAAAQIMLGGTPRGKADLRPLDATAGSPSSFGGSPKRMLAGSGMNAVRPRGTSTLASFLKAQETSPTLVLAHAGVGDEGALEVAGFLATSRHLQRVDLTGAGITSTGAFHLAEAIQQNTTLESLVLKHNNIGEGGEAGIAALCRACRGSGTLRHLDLRRNNLSGALAAQCLGDLLRGNTHLTHLELSWNPLDPFGGQVLLEHLQMNTTLFDCQLSGCRIADETLMNIAQILHRNRRSKCADLHGGSFRLSIEGSPGATAESGGLEVGVTSTERTNEMAQRLLRWRCRLEYSGDSCAHATELLDYLDLAARQLKLDVGAVEDARERVELLVQGFQDREMRYRKDVATAQDKLLDYAEEQRRLSAILHRYSQELTLQRETHDQAHQDLKSARQQSEAEEARLNSNLAEVTLETNEVADRLRVLEERSARQEQENKELRAKVERVREGVVLLRT